MHKVHGQRLKESTLLQNLLSHHHSKIIDGSYAEEGLQSPRCRPTQPLFRSATFLLNLNMSFTTYTKIVTLLNNIQRIAQKHSSNVHREIRRARVVASLFLHLSPVSPCECLHSHTGYFRAVNYPVKTKGSKQLSGHPAHSTRVPRTYRVPTGAGISTPEGTLHPTDSALAQACWRIHSRCERNPRGRELPVDRNRPASRRYRTYPRR